MELSITTTHSTRRWPTKVIPLLAALLLSLPVAAMAAERAHLQLFVMQPYLELHTGPGRGYPVTQVVGRGESVEVLMRRTEWFKVRTERGVEGWARGSELLLAQQADGTPFSFNLGDRAGYADHRWESGIMAGNYAGASMVTIYGALSLTEHLKLDVNAGQFLGNLSNGYVVDVGLSHVFMPQWRFSPFVSLGGGYEHVEPKATLAAPTDSTNQNGYIAVGARCYLTRRLFLRGEYFSYEVFTNNNSNEVKKEWKVGLAFFY